MIDSKAWCIFRFNATKFCISSCKLPFWLILLIGNLFTFGCAVTPQEQTLSAEPAPEPSDPIQVEDRSFEVDTLYSLLVAEIAGDRHRFDIMLSNYVQQAEATQDPGVAARAARLARYLKAHKIALEMTEIWLTFEPNNPEAHFIATSELVHSNKLLEATEHATFLLERGEVAGFDSIALRAQQGGDIETTRKLIALYTQLTERFSEQAQLYLGLSLLYQHSGELDLALQSSQQAIALDPEGFQAAAQETRVLQQMGKTDQALSKLGTLVDRYADNTRLRVQYARALLKTDLSAAQEQFEITLEENPGDSDITLTLALIKYERGLLDEAKQLFATLVGTARYQSTSNYYMGRIARVQNRSADARQHFEQVGPGPEYVAAASQLSEILVEQGNYEQALEMVRNKRQQSAAFEEYIENLYLLESQLLASQGQTHEAINLMHEAAEELPDSTGILYSRAMLYTQLDNLTDAETDFKRVLELAPEHAAALNAWGYTLADRDERLDEAYQMISKAYQLTPDDPAVIDSMGWIEYRLGNIDKALQILRKAMAALPDHEIAAHLGEVLWITGAHDEAREVWKKGLQSKPDSEAISSTMHRLNAL